ncbi:MAG: BrnA antitoxin family protein [Candidatus Accumulibacter sp.]|jgi:uncharacterized protein (DUF4415 family)|nr:BrnA antitoxin family protein [Accumulibacter sp.]
MKKQLDLEVIDDDNPEWTDEEARRAVRFDALPDSLRRKLRGRPKAAQTKERITIRLSPDVVSRFRATGNGWQTRIDSALRDWLHTNQGSGIG